MIINAVQARNYSNKTQEKDKNFQRWYREIDDVINMTCAKGGRWCNVFFRQCGKDNKPDYSQICALKKELCETYKYACVVKDGGNTNLGLHLEIGW
ncbi:MAG TPA: hypothetical protein DCW90_09670 [Lachnospiraceae bacterium]|nr:hypothetical protein [Lachnospiraceae bacterium]